MRPRRNVRAGAQWGIKKAGDVLLSRSMVSSIIAAGAFHRRVRDGNGCFVSAVVTSQRDWQADEEVR